MSTQCFAASPVLESDIAFVDTVGRARPHGGRSRQRTLLALALFGCALGFAALSPPPAKAAALQTISLQCRDINLKACLARFSQASGIQVNIAEPMNALAVSADLRDVGPLEGLKTILDAANVENYTLAESADRRQVTVSSFGGAGPAASPALPGRDAGPTAPAASESPDQAGVPASAATSATASPPPLPTMAELEALARKADNSMPSPDAVLQLPDGTTISMREVQLRYQQAELFVPKPDDVAFEQGEGKPAVTFGQVAKMQREADAATAEFHDLELPDGSVLRREKIKADKEAAAKAEPIATAPPSAP